MKTWVNFTNIHLLLKKTNSLNLFIYFYTTLSHYNLCIFVVTVQPFVTLVRRSITNIYCYYYYYYFIIDGFGEFKSENRLRSKYLSLQCTRRWFIHSIKNLQFLLNSPLSILQLSSSQNHEVINGNFVLVMIKRTLNLECTQISKIILWTKYRN